MFVEDKELIEKVKHSPTEQIYRILAVIPEDILWNEIYRRSKEKTSLLEQLRKGIDDGR